MAEKTQSLDRLDPFNQDDIMVVVETPKGCSNKYAYSSIYNTFELRFVLPLGTVFPYDFGFIPSTKAEDGDPLDVLLLLDQSVVPGCVVRSRLIGAIKAEQREAGMSWLRNDRLLAVATHAHTHAHISSLKHLRPGMLDEIEAFFKLYNSLHGKDFRVIGRVGSRRARKFLKRALEAGS
ncbi:inorganic diphosphatase [Microvirga sp. 2MCAF38]|uniref:inorganic diphosphatase n=1 Tax=Microvirga sp. 2MCAF38 TaxID=3232989 RepID=UPI003F96E03A